MAALQATRRFCFPASWCNDPIISHNSQAVGRYLGSQRKLPLQRLQRTLLKVKVKGEVRPKRLPKSKFDYKFTMLEPICTAISIPTYLNYNVFHAGQLPICEAARVKWEVLYVECKLCYLLPTYLLMCRVEKPT